MMLTDVLEDLELIFSDECPCEAGHQALHAPPCSGDVVALFSAKCVDRTPRICANALAYVQAGFENDRTCWCGRKVRECWVVRPI